MRWRARCADDPTMTRAAPASDRPPDRHWSRCAALSLRSTLVAALLATSALTALPAHGQSPAVPPAAFPQVPRPGAPGIDLEALARRHGQRPAPAQRAPLYLFVSRSMPRGALLRALADAARARTVVVMRGFQEDSIARTREWLHALGVAGAGIEIDPGLFARFRITQVPALVLAEQVDDSALDAQGCAPAGSFRAVQGDVSLAHALTWLHERGPDPALAQALARLSARP